MKKCPSFTNTKIRRFSNEKPDNTPAITYDPETDIITVNKPGRYEIIVNKYFIVTYLGDE